MEENLKLKIKKKTWSKVYYNLLLDNKIIGTGWIIKKYKYKEDAMYFEIIPEMRQKGYGYKFADMLEYQLAEREIEAYWVFIDKKNIPAIKTFDKIIDRYDEKFFQSHYVVYSKALIVY